MKILVTGGAGFIGSNVIDSCIELGHEVAIIDNLSTGKEQNINPKAKFFNADIRDQKIFDLLSEFKPDIINHHAAQIDVRKSVTDPIFTSEVNEIGTLNLLNAAIKANVKKVIFASTGGAIYGEISKKEGADENHPQLPISPYAITKRSAEMFLHFYYATYGLNYTVLRYGNVYGPRQDPLGEAGVIAIFIGKLSKAEEPTIYGNGKQLRDYVFVKDVSEANVLALSKGDGKILNVGSGVGTSVNELFNHLKNIMGFKGNAKYAPPRAGELDRSVLNPGLIKKELGFKVRTSIKEGLEKTVLWHKQQ
ncbi:MAG: UDP-glucose 4-epimerase [Candidatus Saganbacteria bacterium]|uniref:UDP-glucose 4-epimerase n=1 Tax=Candidatus Saganbacteria bacterium TaxID=2575572 RepID=A0A833P3G3_UNCSA|nr:MAG: UDP-glucose 4-epimerase [Candidatus Saganbacteria bacterium]